MGSFVYNEGTWKEIKKKFVYNENSWKEIKKAWTYTNGVWEVIHSSFPPLCSLPLHTNLEFEEGIGPVTFTRASSASYINSSGILQKVDQNVPRFENNMLLMEGPGVNLLPYSEEFDNAAWEKMRCTISANAITAPDGTNTADGIIANTEVSEHVLLSEEIPSTVSSHSISGFFKKGNIDGVRLKVQYDDVNTIGVGYGIYSFDLANGVIGTDFSHSDCSSTAKIIELANDWYRCELVVSYIGPADIGSVQYTILQGESYSPSDGTTIGTYIWGAQLEEIPYVSSYIPTTTAPVSRAPDMLSFPQIGNMPNWDQPIRLEFDMKPLGKTAWYPYLFSTSNEFQEMFMLPDLTEIRTKWCSNSVATTVEGDFSNLTHIIHISDGTNLTTYANEAYDTGFHDYITFEDPGTIWLGNGRDYEDTWFVGHIANLKIYGELT